MSRDPACIFCKIVAGEAEASRVYQDDRVTAFLDIMPSTPGHLLVVPNRHAAGLADLDDDSAAAMFIAARRLAGALRASGLRCEGVNLVLADGEVAGQEVFHVHLHVIPRFPGDPFRVQFGPKPMAAREELEANAARIREALETAS